MRDDDDRDRDPVTMTIALTNDGRYPVLESEHFFPCYEVSSPHFRGLPTEPGIYRIGTKWRPTIKRWDVVWSEEIRMVPGGVIVKPELPAPQSPLTTDAEFLEWLRGLQTIFSGPHSQRDQLLAFSINIDRAIVDLEMKLADGDDGFEDIPL